MNVWEELDRRWVAAATDEELAHYKRFTDNVDAGMASEGWPTPPPSHRYLCVVAEVERRQLAQACGAGGSTNHREVRRV